MTFDHNFEADFKLFPGNESEDYEMAPQLAAQVPAPGIPETITTDTTVPSTAAESIYQTMDQGVCSAAKQMIPVQGGGAIHRDGANVTSD